MGKHAFVSNTEISSFGKIFQVTGKGNMKGGIG